MVVQRISIIREEINCKSFKKEDMNRSRIDGMNNHPVILIVNMRENAKKETEIKL
jgi:hypothetical protein